MSNTEAGVSKARPGRLFSYTFILIVLAIPAYLLSPANFELMDLPEFYTPPRMILSGQGSSIYNVQVLKAAEKSFFPWMKAESVVLYLPPFAVPWLLPAGFVPLAAIGPVWWLALLASVVGSLALLKNCFQLSDRAVLWTGTLLSAFGPQWESMKHGQLAPFLLLSLCAVIWSLKHDRAKLAALALSFLLIKPHLLIPLLAYLAGGGRFRPVLYLAVPAGILLLLSFFMVGPAGYSQYSALMSYSLAHREWMVPEVGPTLRGQLLRFAPACDALVMTVSSAVFLLTCCALFLLGRRFRQRADWLDLGIMVAMPLALVTSLHCHNYDLLLLLPSLAAFARSGLIGNLPRWLSYCLLACGGIFFMPFYNKIHYEYLLAGGVINPFFLILSGFAILLATLAIRTPPSQIRPGP